MKGEYTRFVGSIKPRTITRREQEPPLPSPFPLPTNYPKEVMAGLNMGVLSVGSRTKFFSRIAGAIFNFKSYPTKDEYNHIGHQVIAKYPFLCSEEGTGYVSALIIVLVQNFTVLGNRCVSPYAWQPGILGQ